MTVQVNQMVAQFSVESVFYVPFERMAKHSMGKTHEPIHTFSPYS